MIVRLAKWGNSLAVRIPAAYAKAIGAGDKSKVELSVEAGKLVVNPVSEAPEFSLEALVAGITDDNRHEEVEAGPAVGAEFG